MKPLKSQDYYEIMGVPRHSSLEDIRRAFEICKNTYGDDSMATYSLFSEEENKEILTMMSKAFETLCDPNLRREYDAYLSQLEADPEGDRAEGERMVASMIGLASKAAKPREMARSSTGGASGKAARPAGEIALAGKDEAEPGGTGSDSRIEKFVESVTEFDGSTLKKIRGMRGVSIEELADLTKIRITYLKYLEEENFQFLPAAVYIKGFVTIVAGALGLPAQKVANDYMARYREKVPPT